VTIHLWAGFSRGGNGSELASHGDLLDLGAIGLADDDALIPMPLLERGLLLGEMGSAPVLVAPRDPALQGDGMVREGVETLRAGWSPDPETSETLPLRQLLALHQRHPERQLRLMNISTAAAVESLRADQPPPLSSVCWWHLLADRGSLPGGDASWRVHPSLGGASDREALRRALADQLIRAVSVHAVPMDAEDMLLPPDQRPPGLSGHHLVLPALWDALVRHGGFSIEQLWQGLSFGPSALIDQPPEALAVGSRRWLLFDPELTWQVGHDDEAAPMAANLALLNRKMRGRVTACGLSR
jgi:dihydroorotase